MNFGRKNQQQAQAPSQAQASAGYNPAGGALQGTSWAGNGGYPTQPSGTGYAGYGTGNTGNYAAQNGYASPGAAGTGYGGMPAQRAGVQGYAPQPYGGQPYAGQAYPVQPGAGQYTQGGQASGSYYPQTGQNAVPPLGQEGGGYFGQAPQGYGTAVQGTAQAQGYAQTPQGYAAVQGYSQNPQGGYAYPQMNPASPYGQAAGGVQGGYNPYAQMGRNAQPPQQGGYSQQIPLNGGGYVPPAVPVRKQPFVFQSWMLIALGVVLAALFGASLLLSSTALSWVFIALAAGSITFFWVRPLVSGNRRLCFTIIFAVLIVVALLSALGLLQPRKDVTTPGAQIVSPGGSGTGSNGTGANASVVTPAELTAAPATETPVPEDNSTTDRLDNFFRYWAANRQDEMLTLCAPSWQSSVDNPKTALFGLLANRTPQGYDIEKVSGTSEDTSRTVTVTALIDRNNGKEPVKYRLNVLMVREGDQWFVDPQSLRTYEEAETPDPALQATATPSPEPAASASTILYYNPDGGTKYHLDPNCKSTHAKFLPFKGHFTYSEVNDDKYKNLSPCNVCAAPLRP